MMSSGVTYKLTGTTELSAKFAKLSEDMRRQVVAPAAKDAMDIVLMDAQDRASRVDDPTTPNYIASNIALIERKKMGQEMGAVVVSVGVRQQRKGRKGGNTFYWWWVELGTEHSKATPFMRPALSNNRTAVFAEFLSSAKFQLLKLGVN
jgi:HK97 gp10 family phage protein